jgi:ammonia channel protein AmtB
MIKNLIEKINIARIIVFSTATYALAMFFESGRMIAADQTFKYIPMSVFSLFLLALSLFIIGYWIYFEEKEKNNLGKEFGPYEWIRRKAK